MGKRKYISDGDRGRAERSRLARQAQGATQQDVGYKLKMAYTRVTAMESEGFTRIDTGERLAEALGVSLSWLFWGVGPTGNARVDAALGYSDGTGDAVRAGEWQVAGAVLGEGIVEGAKVSGSAGHTTHVGSGGVVYVHRHESFAQYADDDVVDEEDPGDDDREDEPLRWDGQEGT